MNVVTTTPTVEQLDHFRREGYVVVRRLVDQGIIQDCAAAVEAILDRAAAGEFGPDFRWIHEAARLPTPEDDLLAPEKFAPAFGQLLETLLPFVENILQKPVRCSWLMQLSGGAEVPYAVPLHRDDSMVGGPDEFAQINRFAMNQTYFQAPLLRNDKFLQVVPRSHLRVATDVEAAAAMSAEATQDVPDLLTIELQPGDVVFRHANLLHQGWNPQGLPRWTLVSALWASDTPLLDSERKYFDVLNDAAHRERFPPRLRASVQHYLNAFTQSTG